MIFGYKLIPAINSNFQNNYKLEMSSFKIEIVSLSIFIISFALYAYSHGGIAGMLIDAQTYRSGHGIYSSFDIFKRFFYVGIVPFAIGLHRFRNNRNFSNLIYVVVLLVLNIIALLSLAGRTNLILFFLVVFLLFSRRRINSTVTLIGPILIIAIVFIGDTLFALFQGFSSVQDFSSLISSELYEINRNIALGFVYEFQYPFTSLSVLINEINNIELRYGLDAIYALGHLLPDKLLLFDNQDTVAYVNTELITGIYESTIPPGIIGFSIFSFGIYGIPLVALISGGVYKKIDNYIKLTGNGFLNNMFYLIFTFKLGSFILSGEPRVFIFSTFIFIVLFVFFKYFK
jgi:hypothetical protein